MTETVPETDDLIDRLREPIWTEDVMLRWDYVRKIVAEGHTGSHPRDIIEADLDRWDEDRREAATALEAAQARVRESEAEIQDAALKYLADAGQMADAIDTARREALEEAARVADGFPARQCGSLPVDPAACAAAVSMEIAAAIRSKL